MTTDERYMQRALDLAAIAGVDAAPNPMVGAVIVYQNRVIGEGYHQKYGQAHAEVNAVNSVENKELLSESTIYVTLEPCAHFGKTPPCADLIVRHRFKRVVIATKDPFAAVNGAGIERIKNAGISVDVGVLENKAIELNKRFFTFHQKKRPYIVLKWAESNDGFLDKSIKNMGEINWITGGLTQQFVHTQRTSESAILVGWKTILSDNPSLTVRRVKGKNPLRVIIDSNLQAPQEATVFSDGQPTWVINTQKNEQMGAVRYIQLEEISATSICTFLYSQKILSVYIEGGGFTHQAFLDADLWDEIYRFKGRVNFNEGTSAPQVKTKTPPTEQTIGGDQLFIYRNLHAIGNFDSEQ